MEAGKITPSDVAECGLQEEPYSDLDTVHVGGRMVMSGAGEDDGLKTDDAPKTDDGSKIEPTGSWI